VNEMRCPSEAELLSFVDVDLPPEKLERVELHLRQCASCARQVAELRELIADVAAPLPAEALDVKAHVAGVMGRLDKAVVSESTPVRKSRWLAWGAIAAAAAAVFVVFSHGPEHPLGDVFTARGGADESSLSRDVGLQLYTQSTAVQPLSSGARVRANVAFTAGLRNLGKEQAYLLLFAVDSKRVVHWIAPEYTTAGSDPEAALVSPSVVERLLPTSAVFDDLAPGPLHVYAVLTRGRLRVSNIEQLPASELTSERLLARFPNSEVRQFLLEVTP
jgi:hypothetical protein